MSRNTLALSLEKMTVTESAEWAVSSTRYPEPSLLFALSLIPAIMLSYILIYKFTYLLLFQNTGILSHERCSS